MTRQLSSILLQKAVNEFSKLPGIGKRTAMRLALHLLKQDAEQVRALGSAIVELKEKTTYCKICHNISNNEICECCANPKRNKSIICVVEDIRDYVAIENTGQYFGVYHVLGGIISPLEGISADMIHIQSLVEKVEKENIAEVILALPTTIEGDTTAYYIYKKLKNSNVNISSIAKGISIGDELEYTDEITLGRSITHRVPYSEVY